MLNLHPLPNHSYVSKLPKDLEFNISDACCEPISVRELLNFESDTGSSEAFDSFQDIPLSYSSINGELSLRREICGLYQGKHSASPDDVMIFTGAQEAIFLAMDSVFSIGDEAIVVTPCYPTLSLVPKSLGVKTIEVCLDQDNDWKLDLSKIDAAISSQTKAIIINSPNNPTGTLFDPTIHAELISICSRNDIYLISDEVSAFTNYGPTETFSDIHSYPKGIVINVTSKSFGLAGIRVGWVVTQDQKIKEKMYLAKSYFSICGSKLDSFVAEKAIKHRHRIFSSNNSIIGHNIELFDRFINSNQNFASWNAPQAGVLSLVKLNLPEKYCIDEFAKGIAEQEKVLMLPGHIFGVKGNYFRIGLGKENFAEALDRFIKYVKKLGF